MKTTRVCDLAYLLLHVTLKGRAWSLISSSVLLIFSSWRKAIDTIQFRGELTQTGGIVSRYEIKQLFNTSPNTISEIIGKPVRHATPLPTGMMFSQSCFVSHPSGMALLEYGGLQPEHFS